jgi:hypothetical protein
MSVENKPGQHVARRHDEQLKADQRGLTDIGMSTTIGRIYPNTTVTPLRNCSESTARWSQSWTLTEGSLETALIAGGVRWRPASDAIPRHVRRLASTQRSRVGARRF